MPRILIVVSGFDGSSRIIGDIYDSNLFSAYGSLVLTKTMSSILFIASYIPIWFADYFSRCNNSLKSIYIFSILRFSTVINILSM
jgi:hypothetical protein